MDVNKLARYAGASALMLGASLRLTRLITSDTLGQWLIVEPARSWAKRHWQVRSGQNDDHETDKSQRDEESEELTTEVEAALAYDWDDNGYDDEVQTDDEESLLWPSNDVDADNEEVAEVSNFTPDQREEIARLIVELDPSTWETVSHVTHKDLWADLTYGPPILVNWRAKLVNGLSCPYCVGFWLGAGVIISHELAHSRGGSIYKAWKLVAGALTMNYVVGHIMEVLDS